LDTELDLASSYASLRNTGLSRFRENLMAGRPPNQPNFKVTLTRCLRHKPVELAADLDPEPNLSFVRGQVPDPVQDELSGLDRWCNGFPHLADDRRTASRLKAGR